MKRLILVAAGLLLAAVLVMFWATSRRPTSIELIPSLTDKPEYCLTCHADLPEISASHPVKTFGCVICHGGERLALDADLAHSSMRGGRNPASLDVVQASCGSLNCHSGDPIKNRDHIQRVLTSVQATYAGAIANVRYTFGAQPDLKARQAVNAAEDLDGQSKTGILSLSKFDPTKETNPALQMFAANCLNCHLSAAPKAGPEYAHLEGCPACHTPLTDADIPTLSQIQGNGKTHRLTTAVSYTQCNRCHNRGNYDLKDMQFHPRTGQPTDRLHDYYQPMTQFTRCEWTLDCIDCHTRQEAMGDGDIHSNQKDIQYIRCKTCHGTLTELPHTYTISNSEDIALRLAFLNPVIDLKIGDTIILTEKGEPLWTIRQLPDGSFEQFSKATGQRFVFRPVMGSGCQQNADQQESRYCHQCHAVKR